MASLVLNETGMEDCGIDDSFKYNLYSVVYSVVFVLGLITNCAALFVFCFRMKMRNETTMFMTNLALSDLVFVFTLPFSQYDVFFFVQLSSGNRPPQQQQGDHPGM